jgi:hypothetical protein
MAYPVPSVRRHRPASVAVGVAMLLLATVALAVLAISQFLIIDPVGQAVEAASTDTQEEGFGTFLAAVLFGGGGALNALSAVVLALLAGFDLAGKQAARVMTWIVAPLSALCCGCASAIYSEYLFTAAGAGTTTGQDLSPEQTAAIGEGMPDWYSPAALVAVGLLWIGVLGAVIALAVPSANEYFRKPAQTWLPSYGPPPGYPTEGYPPGYPPPGYPPQQPYPPQWPPTGPQQ